MIQFCLILVSITCVFASVYIHAPCPGIKVAENFDLMKICHDRWYQIARYSNDIESKGDCVINTLDNTDGVCKFGVTDTLDGNVVKYGGYLTKSNTPGIFNIISPALTEEEENKTLPVHVLEYDDDNLMFGYECNYNEATKIRHDYAWAWSRKPTLDLKAKAELEELLSTHPYIDVKKFVWDHFADGYCKKIE